MTTTTSAGNIARSLCGALMLLFASAHALSTDLATEPLDSSIETDNKPNVMFVLDDSGSMYQNFLPDWAGPLMEPDEITVHTPPHRFYNAAFNGIAYNPGVRYTPPVMFAATSPYARETTTYPSQTGLSTAEGASASTKPNWKAVKEDGFGIQSAALINLESIAYSFSTLEGEYCKTAQLRDCTASATPTGLYTFPAKLRWCTTLAKATGSTADSNTYCQASNITTTASGVTNYTFARMPGQRQARITVGAAGTVTSVTVDGVQLLSAASVSGGSSTDLATNIRNSINACTYVITGSCTALTGYSATSAADVVTLYAPGVTSATPVVTGATATATAFGVGGTPGETLLLVITPTVDSYPYPGTAAKHVNRTDCAGATCTYVEEMTNYANWYAYYHTRMQTMKTGASTAFSSVSDKYRVGYYSINATGDFLSLGIFKDAQKYNWYHKFLNADIDVSAAGTPLRIGLANVGRMYAGKLTSLNGVAVADPMQYSCQQNYTILSTDGYWNDASNPKQINGTTDIGQQDGTDERPYYDGATQSKTISQTVGSEEQILINTFLVESKTQHKQSSTSRLTQSVVTTQTYPWTESTTTLRTRDTPLNQSAYNLVGTTYPLTSTTKELQESIFQITSTTRPLESYTRDYVKTTTPLQQNVFKIKKTSTVLRQKEFKIKKTSTVLQQKQYLIKKTSTVLQQKDYLIKKTSTALEKKVFNITVSTSALQTNTFKLQSTTNRQLQKRMDVSSNSGDSWTSTGWVNATSCEVRASGPNSGANFKRNTECQYATVAAVVTGGLTQCIPIAASTGPIYTVANPLTCAYETSATTTTGTTCTAVAQSGSYAAPQVTCTYAAPVNLPGQPSCSAVAVSPGPTNYSGPAVACSYDATATTTTVTSCTTANPANYSGPKVTCGYTGAATVTNDQTTCPLSTGIAFTQSPYTGPKVTCVANTTPAVTNVTSCTTRVATADFQKTKIECGYTGAATDTLDQTTCPLSTGIAFTQSPYTGPKITCTANTTAAVSDVTSCTTKTATADFQQTRIDCGYTGAATASLNQTSCPLSTGIAFTQSPFTGPRITCAVNGTATTTNVTSCTTRADPGDFSKTKIDCAYDGTATDTVDQTVCAASTGAAFTASPYTGPKVTCTYNALPATTTVTSCTQTTAAANASASYTTCTYTGTPVVSASTPGTCVVVPPSTANTYTGPAVACGYGSTWTTATGLTTCTPHAAPATVTCGYGAPVVTTGNSCSPDAPEAGPSYTQGQTVACAYVATAASTSNVASCTPVAQDLVNFSAPEKRCAYETTGTSATSLANCTNRDQSSVAPFVGPNVVCSYSATASATNNAATTCNANRQTASPFSGPAVDCTYNPTATVTHPTTCTTKAQQTGPAYTGGAAIACSYGSPGSWVTATATCNTVAQSAGPNYATARECGYTSPTAPVPVASCVAAPESTGPSYPQLIAKDCVPGAFPVVGAPVVTTVDLCSTDPTSSGSPVVTSTATSCTYQAPVVANTATCTPVPQSASSPYTSAVTCGVDNANPPWVAVATCARAGTFTPPVFDATGKIVDCKTTEPVIAGTGTVAAPLPIDACTPGMDPGTGVQTQCDTTTTSLGPMDPTTCVATVGLATAPLYKKTICTTTTTNYPVGCSAAEKAELPSVSPYRTITCNSADGTLNTLADVAAYYYKTDLRTFALGNCAGGMTDTDPPAVGVLCSASDRMNNVSTANPKDALNTQHMTTFTLGLGASGFMQYSPTYLADAAAVPPTGDFSTVYGVAPHAAANGIAADPASGVCSWQATGSGNCNWPFPASNQQSTIDDLWHTGVNGHGAYFSATDPVSLSASITEALAGVATAGGYSASAGIGNPSVKAGENYAFIPSYTTSAWSGELVRKMVYAYPLSISSTNDWEAQAKLDAIAFASRRIYTYDASASTKLKDFSSANFAADANFLRPHLISATTGLTQFVCDSPDVCLSDTDQDASHASGGKLVDFLRGDRSNEGALKDNAKYYRQRAHVLGDIVNSSAVFVSKPRYSYTDAGYSAFVLAKAYRQAVVYVGANDGMMHAFAAKGSVPTTVCNSDGTSTETECLVDYATAAKKESYQDPTSATKSAAIATTAAAAAAAIAADTIMGQELWAYVPTLVLPNMYKLADKQYKEKHNYYVDATPVVGDICVSDCVVAADAVWKSILVGGLGRGGRGYYALDVTVPGSPKALWEFTDDNMGYSFGNPEITKLRDGTWVVLLSSGYNNIPNEDGTTGDGVARLYVVNAATGALIRTISTGAGTDADPAGLAQLAAQVVSPKFNNLVEAVYGGDLLGNLWRFDVNNDIGAAGYDAQLLAVLKDGAGDRQSITIRPEVSEIPSTGDKIVYVGTGRYLHKNDALEASDASKQQSLYGIKDERALGTTPSTAIFDNPGGHPRPTALTAETSITAAGFVRQLQTVIDCPADTAPYICGAGDKVRGSTDYPVDYESRNGWVVDLSQVSERVNTNPVLAQGALVFNANFPSKNPCSNGKSYQYWLNYLTGGALTSADNPDGVAGVFLGDFMISAPDIVQDGNGRKFAVSVPSSGGGGGGGSGPCTGSGCAVQLPTTPEETVLRRTSWRELIVE